MLCGPRTARWSPQGFALLLHRAIGQDGRTLATVGDAIASSARTAAERYAMLPPDLREHEVFRGYWNRA